MKRKVAPVDLPSPSNDGAASPFQPTLRLHPVRSVGRVRPFRVQILALRARKFSREA